MVWYIIFGIFVVPYRLIRRLQRKRKVADARHHEMLDQARREQRQ